VEVSTCAKTVRGRNICSISLLYPPAWHISPVLVSDFNLRYHGE
jgi:hypothetical protein